eukprot:10797138-Lingulodinium_polyedra.AAC.1
MSCTIGSIAGSTVGSFAGSTAGSFAGSTAGSIVDVQWVLLLSPRCVCQGLYNDVYNGCTVGSIVGSTLSLAMD